jgi:hypothetical protein
VAYLVADRLDSQSLAFISGAACGVAGSVPAAALFFWIHQQQNRSAPRTPDVREWAPQVIVIPSAQQPYIAGAQSPFAAPPFERPQREFTIVGEEDVEDGIT